MTFSLLTANILALALLIGLIPTLIDGLKKLMQTRLSLPEGRAEWYGRVFYLSWLPAMPLAGWLIDEWPTQQKHILFLALVVLILGMAWLALARTFSLLLLNALAVGVAYACLTTTTVRLMTLAFFPHMNPLAGLNVGFIAVGLGAIVGPWIVHAIERWWGYRQGLLYVSIGMIAPGALTAWCGRELFPAAATHDVTWDVILAHTYLGVIAGIILVYFAIENCLEFWPEKYLHELGYRERRRDASMLIFWLAFIAARGAAAWWLYLHPTHGIVLSLLLALFAALLLGNLVSGYEVGTGTFGFWLLGACYGPLLPCLLGVALNLYDRPVPASALGALLALSGLDTLLVRPLMQAFGKDRPARTVMRVPMILGLLMGAPLVVMLFLRR